MKYQESNNIKWHSSSISKMDRANLNGHKGACIWFTGLSGSGKSTLANELEVALHKMGIRTFLLDGDNVRHGLNKNLDFSEEGRQENIRRIGEVAKLFVNAGVIVITALISPFREDRKNVRELMEVGQFIEIHVDCDLAICEERDPKGLYKKARAGEIKYFTGISSPYEAPENPELVLENNTEHDLITGIEKAVDFLRFQKIIPNE